MLYPLSLSLAIHAVKQPVLLFKPVCSVSIVQRKQFWHLEKSKIYHSMGEHSNLQKGIMRNREKIQSF